LIVPSVSRTTARFCSTGSSILAVEVDVDAICDGKEVIIGGIMEHVEQAGIHSGDSGCSLPPFSLTPEVQKALSDQVRQMAQALQVNGIMNTQFAIQNGVIYVSR
jgi:carbamoyl-phosphate synthase large subunit